MSNNNLGWNYGEDTKRGLSVGHEALKSSMSWYFQTFIYMPLKLHSTSLPNTKTLRNFTNQAVYPVYPCVQAVLCCSGFSISLQPFELHVGPVRGEWREQRVALDEVLYLWNDCCYVSIYYSTYYIEMKLWKGRGFLKQNFKGALADNYDVFMCLSLSSSSSSSCVTSQDTFWAPPQRVGGVLDIPAVWDHRVSVERIAAAWLRWFDVKNFGPQSKI